MDRGALTRKIKKEARRVGFDAVGAAPVSAIPPDNLLEWLRRGYQGEMTYMDRWVDKRLDPGQVLEGAVSILSLALNYYHPHQLPYHDPERGAISRYAAGDDYHDVMREKLQRLLERIRELAPEVRGKVYVDTGPVLDKWWASRSGIGWLGKNSNVLAKRRIGSWFFIGEILLDLELDYDQPSADHCGSCARCIEACPTDAIVQPYVVDSRRCISYLTIELRGDVPEEFRPSMGNLIFGCDICQDVCPWNRKIEPSPAAEFRPREVNRAPELRRLARMSVEDYRENYRRSPLKRAKRRGLLRNVAIALGNAANPESVPELIGLLNCDEPMVRRHAAWALKRIGGSAAVKALRGRLAEERDEPTRLEIERLLET